MEMDALPPPELSLDFRPTFVPKTITDFLQEVSVIRDVSDKASRVDGFVKVLEDEIRKINAFKGELPLCVLLLNDGWFLDVCTHIKDDVLNNVMVDMKKKKIGLIRFVGLFSIKTGTSIMGSNHHLNGSIPIDFFFSSFEVIVNVVFHPIDCVVIDLVSNVIYILLLLAAVLFLKNEAVQFTESKSKPVLEEFIPLKKKCDNNENDQTKKEDSRDKKNWMSSVQLWNGDDPTSSGKTIFDSKTNSRLEYKVQKNYSHMNETGVKFILCVSKFKALIQQENSKKGNLFGNEHAFQTCKNRSETRAYIPFKAYSGLSKKDGSDKETVPDLSLLTPGIKNLREESGSTDSRFSCSITVSSSAPNSHSNIRNRTQSSQQQSARKQRRCWSPDLHLRFVNALHQLGGCQG